MSWYLPSSISTCIWCSLVCTSLCLIRKTLKKSLCLLKKIKQRGFYSFLNRDITNMHWRLYCWIVWENMLDYSNDNIITLMYLVLNKTNVRHAKIFNLKTRWIYFSLTCVLLYFCLLGLCLYIIGTIFIIYCRQTKLTETSWIQRWKTTMRKNWMILKVNMKQSNEM